MSIDTGDGLTVDATSTAFTVTVSADDVTTTAPPAEESVTWTQYESVPVVSAGVVYVAPVAPVIEVAHDEPLYHW